jgi:hypothetical protein
MSSSGVAEPIGCELLNAVVRPVMLRNTKPVTSWLSAEMQPASTALLIPNRPMGFLLSAPVGFALLVSSLCFGLLTVRADDLPEDTNKIESLTPEQALRLAQEFVGVQGGFGVPNCLPLNGLRNVDVDTAKALSSYGKGPLVLNGLTSLDAATAAALAEFKGMWLNLSGVTTLEASTAGALAGYRNGPLLLNGLQQIDATTATALATYKGGGLRLNGLTALDAGAAKALAECRGLTLDGLTSLDSATAQALAECRGGLSLDRLTSLDAATAKALASHKGHGISLAGLATLDAATANALAEYRGDLYLSGLTEIGAEAAKALGGFKCRLLVLDGLTTLNATIAKALAASPAWSGSLPHLTTLDAETAKALAEYRGRVLHLGGLTTLDPDSARSLAASHAWDGRLDNLTTLSAATAKALADFKGSLEMPVKVLHESVTKTSLTPDNALVWAALSGGVLPTVTALDSPDSVAIAKLLATWKGPLSLPNLKKISPKTLSALIEKEDIDIPLIETLELIPEPDGSVTEDFVIPEGFQRGRNRQRE